PPSTTTPRSRPATRPSSPSTPAANYNGPDSFTFTASDGTATSNTATITVTVNAVNDAPVAVDGTLTTDEDTAGSVTLSASDVDGDTLTYSATNGAHGTVSVSGNVATYTPAANYNSPKSITLTASEGIAPSTTAP